MNSTRRLHSQRPRLFLEALESRRTPATFTVNVTTDSAAGVGSGSVGDLRYCINLANTTSGADTVNFDAAVFANSFNTITLAGGPLTVSPATSITITGPGANLLTIDANTMSRVFLINAQATATIAGLTLSNGNAAQGGAINNNGTLTLLNSAVNGSSSSSKGGGIYNTGALTLRNSVMAGNSANSFGGGIFSTGSTSSVTLTNSTLTGNSAGAGGGIYGNYAHLLINNATISGNTAVYGGGVHNRQNSLTALVNVTSSIVSGNLASIGPDLRVLNGPPVALNFSAVGSSDGFAFTGVNNLPFGANLKLGPVFDYGGPTKTVALLPGSPAIDAGANPLNLTTDQRGKVRVNGPQADIGACEWAPNAPALIVTTAADVVDALDNKISLREALAYADANSGADTINFDPTVFAAATTITMSGAQFILTNKFGPTTIAGPGADLLTIDANSLSRVLQISSGAYGVIDGVTLTKGQATDIGGAIACMSGATLTLANSAVTASSATTSGGGIDSQGTITVINSTLSANSASHGGAIAQTGGSLTLSNSTVGGNTAVIGGGVYGSYAVLYAANSTIVGNLASTSGGGIHNRQSVGSGSLTVTSAIVSGNVGGAAPDMEITGTGSASVNSSAIGANGGFTLTGSKNLPFGTNLKLGALANNGGRTLTFLPANDSPLIDAGSAPASLVNDQRGSDRVSGLLVDIGAVEAVQDPLSLIVTTASDVGNGFDHKTSLREALNYANAKAANDTVSFDATIFASAQTITLNGSQLSLLGTSILAPGAHLLTIDANKLSSVFLVTGKVTIDGLTLTNGKSTEGGGIYNLGTLTLLNSAVSGNSADVKGGGIFNYSTLTVLNSVISNNSATSFGGGIFSSGLDDAVTLINSTLTGNSAGTGGGIYGNYAKMEISNTTVSGNSAVHGGGVHNRQNSTAGTVAVTASIVSGNSATYNPDFDVSNGPPVALNFSAVGSSSGFVFAGANNLPFGTDLKIGTLANNGGTTKTMALLSGSPAIDAGANAQSLTTDQRGKMRVSGAAADIGAYEMQFPAKVAGVVINGGAAQRSMVAQVQVNFNQHVAFASNAAPAFTLTRVDNGAAVNLAASVDDTSAATVVTLTFTGGAVNGSSLADGRYTLNILAAQIVDVGLDGNGDGVGGDNYVLIGAPANGLFRLYGDSDGDNDVDTSDFGAFRAVFGGSSSVFDFDNDGDVDTSDFGAFRGRFGATI